MKALLGWFSPERRVALYAVALVAVPFLARLGLIGDAAVEPWLIVVQAALQVLAGVLMLANLSVADAATWFVRGGRATIYSLGAFVAPALTALGVFTDAQAEVVLLNLADALSLAAALLAALYITPTKTRPADDAGHATVGRVVGMFAAFAVALGAFLVVGAPAARGADLPVVPPGCVWTGGGLACGVGSEIVPPADEPVDEPAEAPVDEPAPDPVGEAPVEAPVEPAADPVVEPSNPDPEPVEPIVIDTAPPAPTFIDPCGADNVQVTLPADPGPWLFFEHRDPVGGSGYVQPYLPEGYEIGDTGTRYWWPVFEFRDSQLPCVAVEVPVPVGDLEPIDAEPVAQLAETGPDDMTGIAALAGLGALVLGLGLFFLNHRARRAR